MLLKRFIGLDKRLEQFEFQNRRAADILPRAAVYLHNDNIPAPSASVSDSNLPINYQLLFFHLA